jgi:hypothetical protein
VSNLHSPQQKPHAIAQDGLWGSDSKIWLPPADPLHECDGSSVFGPGMVWFGTWNRNLPTPIATCNQGWGYNECDFSTKDWELANPNCYLQALDSSISDHCPMLLTCNQGQRRYKGFRFEASCLHMVDFQQLVHQSWTLPVCFSNRARTLHIKLACLAKTLKRWLKQRIMTMRKDADDAQQIIL